MMIKKLLLTAILFFALNIGKAQNLNIIVPTYSDTCNKLIEVPIKVANFNSLLALQFSVGWDKSKLNFVGVENYGPVSMNLASGNFGLSNASATGSISFSWNDGTLSGVSLTDSTTLFVLKFLITGSDGTSGNISIQNSPTNIEAIKTNFQNESIIVVGGGINISCPSTNFLHLIAPTINETCSKIVEVPIRATNFKDLVSTQFTLKWNPNYLGFINISNLGDPSLSINSNAFGTNNVQNGMLSFSWNDASMLGKTIADTAILFKIRFFTSSNTTPQSILTFTNDLATVEAVNKNIVSVPVNLFSGNVSITCANQQGLNIIAPSLTDTCGKTILVPIKATQFSNLLSTQFSMGWDFTKLAYQGIESFGNSALNLSNSNFGITQTANGILSFSWNDASAQGVSIADTANLFILKFGIIGADLEASAFNILNSPTVIEAINVGLTNTPVLITNGRINIICPSPTPLGLIINNYADTCNKTIDIPIKVSNFKDLLSLQFSLSWNPSKLTFVNISNYGDAAMQLNSGNFGLLGVNNGQLSFSWNDASLAGVNLADSTILFKVRFTLTGDDGDTPIVNIVGTSTPIEAVNKNLVVLPTMIIPGKVTIRCPQPNELALVIPSTTENCGTDIEVPISAVQFSNILSLQFSLGWDKTKLNFLNVTNYGPASLQLAASNFGTSNANNGSISFSWNDGTLAGKTIADSTILFKLKFSVIGTHGANALLSLTNTPIQIEAINTSLTNVPTHVVDGNIQIECTNCSSVLESGTTSISFCTGGTYTLTASPSAATSYEWYRNNIKVATTSVNSFVINNTGSYTVQVLNNSGCLSTSNTVIANNYLPPTITISSSPVNNMVCIGSNATLTASGALTYIWTGGIINGVAFTPTQTGTYTVTGIDVNGCSSTASKIITLLSLPNVTISSSTPSATICLGQAITLSGNGASNYSWTGGIINGTPFSPTQSGTYTLTGTDVNGCSNIASQVVTIKTLPIPSITSNPTIPTICIGENIILTASGGISYSWTGGITNGTIFAPTQSGTYTVTVLGVNGCSATSSIFITVNNLPAPTISITSNPQTPTVCLGQSITLTATGGVSYTWSGGVTNGVSFIPSQTSSYTVTGVDANGCKNTANTTVVVKSLPIITITSSPSNATVCSGSEITLTASGASTYTWTSGVINGVPFTPSQTGTYTVTGTDLNGCTNSNSKIVTVNNLPAPVISVTSNPISSTICLGQNITLTASGALSYNWQGGIINGIPFAPTQSGTYTVTGTDVNGCKGTATKTVTVNNLPNVVVISSPSNATVCLGENLTLSGSGAITYTWQGGIVNGVSFTPIQTGTYTLTGTDANGCSNTINKTVTVHNLPTVLINTSPANSTICIGDPVILTATGATLYTWQGGISNGVAITPNVTTTYTVTGTDINGCSATASKTVIVNALPNIGAISNPVSGSICIGGNVSLNGTGGVSYSWSNGVVDGQLFTPTQTTTYTVTGTDVNGCRNTATKTITVINSPAPTIVINSNPNTNSICLGTSITLTASGGLTYLWNGGIVDGQSFTPTQTATYLVTGTDVNGCSNIATKTIVVNALPVITASVIPNSGTVCLGDNIKLLGNGGVSYVWTGGVTNAVAFAATQSGTYTVTGTDINGCINFANISIQVNQLPRIFINSNPSNALIPLGSSIILTATGAQSYQWSNGVVNGVGFVPTQTTRYIVRGFNSNGCSDTSSIVVNVNNISVKFVMPEISDSCFKIIELPVKVASFSNIISTQFTIGWDTSNLQFLNISNFGTTGLRFSTSNFGLSNTINGNISFSWSDPTLNGVSLADSSLFFSIKFKVKGKNGITTNVKISNLPTPIEIIDKNMQTLVANNTEGVIRIKCIDCIVNIQNGKQLDSICDGNNYVLSAIPSNNINYIWFNNGSQLSQTNSNTISINLPGEYYVKSTNEFGCEAVSNKFILNYLPLPVSKIISVPSNPKICIGDSIQLTALGANKYNWSNGILNGKAFSPIKSGTYSLTTIGLNGCSTNDSISIQVNERPIVSISSEKYFCPGSELILKANTNGLLNQWFLNGNIINGATSVNYTVKQEGIYSLISTNSFGCANNYLVADTILLPSLPIIDFSYDNYCINNKIKFTNLSKAANSLVLNWTWSFGLSTSGALIENPIYTYTEAGTYNVSLKVNYAYCPSLSSNLIKKVTIVQPTLNKKYDTVFAEANTNKIISARNIGISYNWKPNIGINDTSIMSPVFKYDLRQSYQIKIVEKSGCVITDTLVVAIIKKEGDIIFVPNAFTPNGDGQNDQLAPFFVGIKKFISFSVYNRWGQLLYKTENQGLGWDGTYNGSIQPIETYVWMCEVLDENDSIVRKVGQTILIR